MSVDILATQSASIRFRPQRTARAVSLHGAQVSNAPRISVVSAYSLRYLAACRPVGRNPSIASAACSSNTMNPPLASQLFGRRPLCRRQ